MEVGLLVWLPDIFQRVFEGSSIHSYGDHLSISQFTDVTSLQGEISDVFSPIINLIQHHIETTLGWWYTAAPIGCSDTKKM